VKEQTDLSLETCLLFHIPSSGPLFTQPDIVRAMGISADLTEIGWEVVGGLDSSGSGYGPVTGCCENGNEPSGSMKCTDFLD